MAAARQGHDASSDDTVVSHVPDEKAAAEASPNAQEPVPETADQHDPENDKEDNENDKEDNAIEKQPSGATLDRTPSQAAKMGKKKIVVIMVALCVRNPAGIAWNISMKGC